MTTAIAKYQPQTLPEIMEVGKILASSGFFSDAGGAAQAVAKIIAGQELGFGPMAALTGIYIVNGRVTLSANLMAAAIKRSGKYNYRVTTLTDQEVVIEFSERVDGKWAVIGVSSLTMKEARAAELHMEWDKKESKWREKATWKKFPKNMLFARALSNGAKWYTPDIMGGPLYTPDEFDLPTDEDGVVIEGGYTPSVVIEDQPEPTPEPVQEPTTKRSNGKAPEARVLTKTETRELYDYAKACTLSKPNLMEALDVSDIAEWSAVDPLTAGKRAVDAWLEHEISNHADDQDQSDAMNDDGDLIQPPLIDDDTEQTKLDQYSEGA